MANPRIRFEFFQGKNSRWFWRTKAPNGRTTADCGFGYATRRNAVRAAQRHAFCFRGAWTVQYTGSLTQLK